MTPRSVLSRATPRRRRRGDPGEKPLFRLAFRDPRRSATCAALSLQSGFISLAITAPRVALRKPLRAPHDRPAPRGGRPSSFPGALRSRHLTAEAADIKPRGRTVATLYAVVLKLIHAGKLRDGGVGRYRTWLHYDIGPARRWG